MGSNERKCRSCKYPTKKEEVDAIDKALGTMEMSAVFGSTATKERK